MARYAAGDESAFADLYDLVVPGLYGYLLRKLRKPELAEDLLQRTLLNVHRARGSFLPGAPVLPWVLAIARRLIIDDVRSAAREPGWVHLTEAAPIAADTVDADELVEASETASRIEREVARLPGPQRDAFELVEWQGLSLAEAAESLQITIGALKVRLHRARRTLHAALATTR